MKKKNILKKADDIRFIQVKISSNNSEGTDQTSSMKQNIEIMNQLYKNLGSVYSGDYMSTKFGQNFIVLEMIVEKEMINYIMGIPQDYVESFEKLISSFYPGSVVDKISQNKILNAGNCVSAGDIVLSKSDTLPIKIYDDFEADPIDSILSSFSKTNWDEKLILQFVISPLSDGEQSNFSKAVEACKTSKKKSIFGLIKKIFDFNSDEGESKGEEKSKYTSSQTQDIDKKGEGEFFNVKIRTLAISPDQNRADKFLRDIQRSLSQYNYAGLNKLSVKKPKNLDDFLYNFIYKSPISLQTNIRNILKTEKGHIFSIKELSSLYHFPHSKFNKNPRIRWQNFKIVPAPDTIPSDGLYIGNNLYSGVNKKIRVKPEDRFRHFYCIGQTGTGKSTMLTVQAKDDLINGRGFCMIDPHGDLCESLLGYFPKERINDLIYFDAADFQNPIGLNAFEAENEEQKDVVVSDLVDMFVNLYGHEIFGPRIQDYFRNGALTLMDQPDGGTMVEIVRLFADEAFQKTKLKNVKNPVVRNWWEKTYAAMGDREKAEAIPFFQAKFGQFTTTPILRNIIGQTESSFKMSQVMQENKVLLVNLSKGKLGEINSELIGRIITTQVKVAALQRASMPENERIPFYLYIDEFQNYVSQSIESILSEARKYKLGLTVAHQYIDQLRSHGLGGDLDLSKAIFGNVGSIMAYKVGPEDAEFLERVFAPEFSKSDLVNMDKYKGVMRLSVDSQPTKPFSIATLNPFTPFINSPEKIKVIKEISSLKWGRKKELVEKEIYYKVGV
ncbi:type IV secretory system conjugative DNA transfer family protein [Candidatus Vampirococcus lugosii]|uniref:Archaeal DNA helicase HerA or a related bacterial ATPase n=1 Tax=Candidatus Vampirococcus lugosii TaxID=2789015 RepID=A0ABS5QKX6_9BACT|nr:type IV secretory system conjugative DNA transfer family protein [Candidatus Vampirococcus lugosii]MBS8121860.1 Archaeal DNA helicase HerA or a related bacterial ATPase [Candidatus Vampirococcus lugosii]